MRKRKVLLTIVFIALVSPQVNGVGIFMGRQTFVIPENGRLNENITYWLFPPQGQYSTFQPLAPMGLNTTITGCNAVAGIEYRDDGSLFIDWDAAGNPSSIDAYVSVSSPDNWQCPAEAGGDRYIDNLVFHSEGFGSVTMGVFSQIALYRNYAPKASLQSLATTELAVSIGLQFEDKNLSWWANSAEHPWFSYSIDWDGDGSIDQTGTATFNEEPVPDSQYPTLSRWTSGIQISTLQLDHLYDAVGNYNATLILSDSMETTTWQIPIEVIPEPATLLLFGFGVYLIKRRR
ncbi:MAG: hypothetical protein A2Y10_13005 [Planctomycetes bacterium GWF2_41_51]|nr:MAG: hypothetical protein A2Y10_13005 [Planctomycetes bacterium GWF2_41_51]HBG60725.1 hypothetical protein [Candidatus Omnitrophota bacterium]